MNLKTRNLIILGTAVGLVTGAWIIAILSENILQESLVTTVSAILFIGAAVEVFFAIGWWFSVSLLQMYRKDNWNEYQTNQDGGERVFVPKNKEYKELGNEASKTLVIRASRQGRVEPIELESEFYQRLKDNGGYSNENN